MAHDAELIRTHNDDPAVPDALHVRCSCGWSTSATSEEHAQQLLDEHVANPSPPAPFAPSPD